MTSPEERDSAAVERPTVYAFLPAHRLQAGQRRRAWRMWCDHLLWYRGALVFVFKFSVKASKDGFPCIITYSV